ncbi:helix-turn-helix domain-containing protein [Nonomuraea endophytica]|uniref:helix-turn-helix domain-containing protein n=1 Tax=Nonomuraea endophytica TaxID=714136 RepID=UPI0037C53FD8
MNRTSVPTVQRRLLAIELKRLRERSGMTGDDLARQLGWSPSKVSRVENARISISEDDTGKFLDLFDVSPSRRSRLIKLAAHSPTPTSWRHLEPLAQNFLAFLEIEALSTSIRQWSHDFVPGILQTEQYAKTLLDSWRLIDTNLTARQVEERVALRLGRQSILEPPASTTYRVILDESVLMRKFGSNSVMRGQMAKLIDMSARTNIDLFILPLNSTHGVLEAPFVLLNLSGDETPGSSLPYLDSNTADHFVFDDIWAAQLEREFDILHDSALSGDEARELIQKHHDGFAS